MRKNILIRNARVFNAADGSFAPACDILVKDGIVAEMAQNIEAQPGYDVLEGENLCASTGWTDCHTHVEDFDPFLSYPALGVTRIHEAGSFGAYTYEKFHNMNSRMPFPITAYLYVGCYGVAEQGAKPLEHAQELMTLDNIKEEPFLETVRKYPDEIVGAKIRIDPRVNCDTKKSLRMAKELAVKAGLPLIVHPSRCTDTIEEILEVMDKDDVLAHTYSPVCPTIFDEDGKIKQAVWDAVKRGVRFDLSHGSNNFSYEISRKAIEQGFVVETVSTDLHFGNYTRTAMDLAGIMTKAIQGGMTLEETLKKVIITPSELLHVEAKAPTIEVGQTADITVFTVSEDGIDLPDVTKKVETCKIVVNDVATIMGSILTHSVDHAYTGENYWKK